MTSQLTRIEAQRLFRASDARAADELWAWVQRVILASHPGDNIDDDQALLTSWAYTLEACADLAEAGSIARLLRDYASILDLSLNPADLAWLGEIAAKAERLLDVGDRYLKGKLSPGAWSAFLAKIHLPPGVKDAMRQWTDAQLLQFLTALRTGDYGRVRLLLGAA